MQKSTPVRIPQLVIYISKDIGQVDKFMQELTFAKRLYKQLLLNEIRPKALEDTLEDSSTCAWLDPLRGFRKPHNPQPLTPDPITPDP